LIKSALHIYSNIGDDILMMAHYHKFVNSLSDLDYGLESKKRIVRRALRGVCVFRLCFTI